MQGWGGCRYLQQLHGSVVVQPLLLQCYRRPDVLLVAFEAQPLPQLLLLLQEGGSCSYCSATAVCSATTPTPYLCENNGRIIVTLLF